MEDYIKSSFAEKVKDLHLPRYDELPTIGLYLDQVIQYVNSYLVLLDCPEITASMVSNYVKQGIVPAPSKKQYSTEAIAYLIYICICKNVLTIEGIGKFLAQQKHCYETPDAYDYFCKELENVLQYIGGIKKRLDNVGVTNSILKTVFRSSVIASAHALYVNHAFIIGNQKREEAIAQTK